MQQVSNRTMAFTLKGTETKKIPLARPQILVKGKEGYIIFRDAERGDKVSVYICKDINFSVWKILDLSNKSVGQWEPSFDTELWKKKKVLHLFVQVTGQGDGEKIEKIGPQMVSILEWLPEW